METSSASLQVEDGMTVNGGTLGKAKDKVCT